MKKYVNYIFTDNICSAWNPMKVIAFLKIIINFVEKRLRLSHFEGSDFGDELIVCVLSLEFVWEKTKIKGKHVS